MSDPGGSKSRDRGTDDLPAVRQVGTLSRGAGAGLMVFAACGFLALAVVYMESANIPGVAGRLVADLAFLIPLALSMVLSFVAFGRSKGVEKRFWLVAALLYAVLLYSELHWLYIIVRDGTPPPPIYFPFQLLHLIASILFLALLASLVRLADTPAPLQARWWIDMASVTAVVFVLVLKFVVTPILTPIPGLDEGVYLINTVYTTWGVMMIAGCLWVLLRPGVMRWRLWERFIAVSMLIYAAGIAAWPVWFVAYQTPSAANERSIFDVVLVGGLCLFAIAAADRVIRADQAWPMRRLGPVRRLSGRMQTYLALGVSVIGLPGLLVAAVLTSAWGDRTVYIVAAAVIAALTVGRTILSAVENGRLFHTAVGDPLTGLYNHRYFHERLCAELDEAQRYGEPLSVAWVDIDDFGRFNRLAGHSAGDDVLRAVAGAVTSACEERCIASRVGGDEFAVIGRGSDVDKASAVAERLGSALREAFSDGAVVVTVSGGIVTYPLDGDDATTLARRAEHTARWARRHRKGQVVHYDAALVGETEPEEAPAALEERTRLGTVRALAAAVDARREASGARSAAVASLSVALARHLGLDEERVRLIETAALVHDVGMVALGDAILTKPGPLSPSETEEMRRHPALGQKIVGASAPAQVGPWIRLHHERWDGEGYPDGLRAVAIPLESRIIAVCDAWDAMISERPYRRAMTPAEAVAELRACAGTQFDPELVEPLVALVGAFHRL